MSRAAQSLPHSSPSSVVEVLLTLERVGLECIGARALGSQELELRVASRRGDVDPGTAIQQAWPSRSSHLLLERLPDAVRARLLVRQGLWVAWQAPRTPVGRHAPERERQANRMVAYEVHKGEGDRDEEVVMAASPDQAAAYYAQGWGLTQGTLLTVAWEERTDPRRHTAAVSRQTRLFRVLNAGRVATLPG